MTGPVSRSSAVRRLALYEAVRRYGGSRTWAERLGTPWATRRNVSEP